MVNCNKCFKQINYGVKLSCNHSFHYKCFDYKNTKCQLCNNNIISFENIKKNNYYIIQPSSVCLRNNFIPNYKKID